VGATPYNIGYSYDADNRQTHVTYPDGAIVDRTFTVRHQLQTINYNGNNVATLNYDDGMRLTNKMFGNGLIENRTYRNDNLLTTIDTPGVTTFGYTWDANKRKLSQTETGIPLNDQNYTYDNEDRLASFNRNNGDNQTWNLSLVGDWNQFNNNGNIENRTHNAVHELTAVNAVPLAYDVKGNLTGNSNGQVYVWDVENRLTTATDNQNNTLGTYTYDALGRRVSKTVGALTTVFVSDGLQKICEYENGTLARSYAYGSYIDEPLVMISGVNKYYYHSNNLYSVAALTDNVGTVIERYKYDPYGKATILAADGVTTRISSIVNNPFMYDGYYHDAETGLEFVNARYYSSDLGRFIARDPIGYIENNSNVGLFSLLVNSMSMPDGDLSTRLFTDFGKFRHAMRKSKGFHCSKCTRNRTVEQNCYEYVKGQASFSVDPTGLGNRPYPFFGTVVNESDTSIAVAYSYKDKDGKDAWAWCRLRPGRATPSDGNCFLDADGWCDPEGRCFKVSDLWTGTDKGDSQEGGTSVKDPSDAADKNHFSDKKPPDDYKTLADCACGNGSMIGSVASGASSIISTCWYNTIGVRSLNTGENQSIRDMEDK
jgi:RHS repeat-associated protein